MRARDLTMSVPTCLLTLGTWVGGVDARPTHDGVGSAIALEYTIRHDVIRPGEEVELLACVTNQNPHARRSVETGDRFTFDFGTGVLGPCLGTTAWSPGGLFEAGDFSCLVTGSELAIERVGPDLAWTTGATACARVGYSAGSETTTVATRQRVGKDGAYAPQQPAAVLLTVGAGLGSIGPTGPTGPVGPAGPRGATGPAGPSGIGGRWRAASTGSIAALPGDPPEPIPGLELTVNVKEGSRVQAIASVPLHERCHSIDFVSNDALLHLEIDGAIVESRLAPNVRSVTGTTSEEYLDVTIPWLSDPLADGEHLIRVLIEYAVASDVRTRRTLCAGADADSELDARLVVLEIPAEP